MDDTRMRLARCFSAVFPNLRDQEIASASLETVDVWDSVATITLVTVIEEEFGVQFELDRLERLVSFPAILDCLTDLTPRP